MMYTNYMKVKNKFLRAAIVAVPISMLPFAILSILNAPLLFVAPIVFSTSFITALILDRYKHIHKKKTETSNTLSDHTKN